MVKKRVWCLTMFDNYFDRFLDMGVIGQTFRGDRGGDLKLEFHTVSIPEFSKKGFKGVDDSPYGGGVGMIMRADVLREALIEGVLKRGGYKSLNDLHVICPAPRGRTWNHEYATELAQKYFSKESSKDLVFICGRYEGIDERFLNKYVDEFISLGDYILTGGELAVMVILDSALRFSPGILGNKMSAVEESFQEGLLEHALYTRPYEFEGEAVPEELKSGDPKKINKFKEKSAEEITLKHRPDLLKDDRAKYKRDS